MKNFQEFNQIIDAIEIASRDQLKEMALIRQEISKLRPSQHLNNRQETTGMRVTRSLSRQVGEERKEKSHHKNDALKEKNKTESKIKLPTEINDILRVKKRRLKGDKSPLEGNKNKNSVFLDNWRQSKGQVSEENLPLKGNKKTSLSVAGGVSSVRNVRSVRQSKADSEVESETSTAGGNTPGRDAGGRFKARTDSAAASAETQEKNARRAEQKQQQGFFRSLGSMLESATETNSDSMSSGADIAGTAAGGPLWMMGKGMYDISAEVGKNIVTLKNFMQGKTEGNAALKMEPPLIHPPVTTEARTPPAIGKPKSADGFKNAQQAKAIQVTQEQTKVIAANDDRIVDALDDVREEVKKLSHTSSKGAGGLMDSLIPGRRKRRGRKRGPLSAAADVADVAGDLLPDGKGKPDASKPKPKPKKKGLLAKAMEVLKGGKKAATVAGAAATTAAAGATIAAGGVSGKEVSKAGEKATQTAAEKTTEKGGLKVAGKVAGKTALKAIPLVGTVIGAGMDAYEGYNDTDGQQRAFGVKEGDTISGRQKSEYTTANVLNMGGLVSGASGLLASGASALGMNGIAKSLTFDTGDIAKGLDSGLSKVGDMFSAFSTSASGVYDKLTGTSAEQTKAITDGTTKTVTAINRLGSQLQGGEWGEDGVGTQGKSTADYADVAKNSIGADLNVGGANAKVRSFRNNNFGNLNYVGQEGASLEAKNGKGEARFAKFNTPEEGFRALANQLTSYSEGTSKAAGYQKLNTVQDIIKLYAPESENNTSQYVDSLSKKLGVRGDEQLNLKDPKVMTQMMRGIATIEGGNPQVTNDFMMNAIGHNENGKWVGGKFSDESLKSVNEARAKQGQAPIAADSLYSTGEKVKLTAGAVAPAAALAPISAPVTAPAVAVPAVATTAPTVSQVAAAKEADKNKPASGAVEKIKHAGAGAWSQVKALNKWADGKVQGATESLGVAGMSRKRPTSGLSLPAGESLPAGLQLAALSPDQIASRSRPAATSHVSTDSVRARPGSATSDTPITVASTRSPAAAPEARGLFDRMLGGARDGVNAVSASIMPAISDTFSQTLGGFSGNDMVSSVLDQAGISDPGILRAISPLTSKAGGWLDSGTETLASAGKSYLSGSSAAHTRPAQQPLLNHPAQIQNVTDLPRSGMRPMMSSDTSNHDQDMLKELKGMRTQLEALLGVTKKKSDTAPDKVVNTAQPAPRTSSTLSISDPALNDLLQD
ncbi:hypothetical protein U9K49_23155 (plasmid) [Pantoea agglomerans]|uniref:hypothetical protein n=1 Tax=Enterobacter agglomerans TaxID=549 RepID=UPI002D7A38F6|nr:hypothetical protein [Pantoea agglomerans]WRO92848.1 hypothetical protein U9K49_23155 [Pantoea agglomerans]